MLSCLGPCPKTWYFLVFHPESIAGHFLLISKNALKQKTGLSRPVSLLTPHRQSDHMKAVVQRPPLVPSMSDVWFLLRSSEVFVVRELQYPSPKSQFCRIAASTGRQPSPHIPGSSLPEMIQYTGAAEAIPGVAVKL
jgi:hypothetical protein